MTCYGLLTICLIAHKLLMLYSQAVNALYVARRPSQQ